MTVPGHVGRSCGEDEDEDGVAIQAVWRAILSITRATIQRSQHAFPTGDGCH